jgi:hypothetical protein
MIIAVENQNSEVRDVDCHRRRLIIPILIIIIFGFSIPSASASNIFVKEGRAVYYVDKTFLENSQILKKPIIIQYFGENSVSIILSEKAVIGENEITIEKGEQFILDHNGKVSQRLKFENTVLDNTLGIEISGTYIEGEKAMVKFDGLFSTLLIEEQQNGKRKVSLAQKREFNEETQELHLFDGFTMTLDKDNNLEEQVSFRELAFGGTLKCEIDAGSSFAKQAPPSSGVPVYNPAYPPIIRDEDIKLNLDLSEYEIPPLKKIGVIPFKDQGELIGFADNIPQIISGMLGKDVEVVFIDLPEEEQQGIYLFNRAVRFGKEHSIDAIMQGRIRRFEELGSDYQTHFAKETRVTCEIEASLVDTVGGKYIWKNVAKVNEFVNSVEYNERKQTILSNLLEKAITSLTKDLRNKKALDGGKIK